MNKIAMIAAAGRGSRMLSLTENNPKAMLPFNCKPIIGHHLDYLIEEGFNEVVIIVGYQKEKLIDYVNQFYINKINIRFAEQKELNGLAGAISCGIETLSSIEKTVSSLFILLGDIILDQKIISYSYNFVGFDYAQDWSRWCMVETDEFGDVIKFIDKPDNKPNTNKNLMGVYNICDILTFEQSINKIVDGDKKIRNEYQISQVLEKYIESYNIVAEYIQKYFDLGELDALNKTRKNITRHFNTITATDDNTIIKTSSNIVKIQKEIDWFIHLDMKLSLYTPNLVSFDYKKGSYELEFIHSNPIQELYLFNLPESYQWISIFKNVKKFIDKSRDVACVKQSVDEDNYKILVQKTLSRVEMLKEYDFAKDNHIIINNTIYKNPIKHLQKILEQVEGMFCYNSEKYFSSLHGDLFFGNMLYDVNTNTLKVIDPRGEYGYYTNYGDIRYDIAKLNHSVNGYYDFIVNGLYFLEEVNGEYFYNFYESKQNEVKDIFNTLILKDYNIKEINLLTGLLFLTMIPLHSDNPKNQKMQFIKAVEFLNEFI